MADDPTDDVAEVTERPMPGQVEFTDDEEKAMRSRPRLPVSDLSRPALPASNLSRPSLKDLAGPGRRSLKDLGE